MANFRLIYKYTFRIDSNLQKQKHEKRKKKLPDDDSNLANRRRLSHADQVTNKRASECETISAIILAQIKMAFILSELCDVYWINNKYLIFRWIYYPIDVNEEANIYGGVGATEKKRIVRKVCADSSQSRLDSV